MDLKRIYERRTNLWHKEDGNVIVVADNSKYVLNQSASIIWEMIDGIKCIEDIFELLIENYSEENKKEHLYELLDETMKILTINKLVVLKSDDELMGWD